MKKCKRGTRVVEKVQLLSSAANASIRSSGSKGARHLLSKVLAVTTCSTTSGERVVVSATMKKGRTGRRPFTSEDYFPGGARSAPAAAVRARASKPLPPVQDESMWAQMYPGMQEPARGPVLAPTMSIPGEEDNFPRGMNGLGCTCGVNGCHGC